MMSLQKKEYLIDRVSQIIVICVHSLEVNLCNNHQR